MTTTTATAPVITLMYADGPLVDAFGELLCHQVQDRAEPAMVTVRCIDADGKNLAEPVSVRVGSMGYEALQLIVGQDKPSGEADAERFWRRADTRYMQYQEATGRGRVIAKRLLAFEFLALAAVKREVPATVTWG